MVFGRMTDLASGTHAAGIPSTNPRHGFVAEHRLPDWKRITRAAQTRKPFTALFAQNDISAIGSIQAFLEPAFRVPKASISRDYGREAIAIGGTALVDGPLKSLASLASLAFIC